MNRERINRCFEGGMSVLVATADGDGMPACCRGVALVSNDDLRTATLYLPVQTAQETIANVATTRRIAVTCSSPLDHVSVQLKGTTRTVRLARSDEAGLLGARLEDFVETLTHVGLPRHLTRRLTHWPAFAIELAVEEIFDQTPGPNAGQPIR